MRGRVGDERTGATEQLDARELADLAVHGDGGGGLKVGFAEKARGYGALQIAERRPIGRDGDLFNRA